MKKLSILFAFVLILSLFAGCASSGYKLIAKDGNYYIRLKDISSDISSNSENMDLEYPAIRFDTVAEMKHDIETGNFTQEELKTISATFKRNEDGLIPLSNFSKLYEPTFPEIFDDYTVSWFSTGYSFFLSSSTDNVYCNVSFPKAEYNSDKIEYYSSFDTQTETIQSKTENADGSVTYDFYDALNQRRILTHYTLETNNKSYFIVEQAFFENSDSIVRYSYNIYGTHSGQSIHFNVRSLSQPITREQLSQFGIREYVETVTE